MSLNFVHLHTHSEYSLLDGASRIKDLVSKAKEFEMPALALTDHGGMYGAIEFYETAKNQGIKPIIGCEIYVATRSRFDKSSKKEDSANHLLLLAQNNQGYRNLMKLVSLAYFEGFYYKPRVDKELLKKYHDGLIALTACLTGEIPKLLKNGKKEEAKKAAEELSGIFGADNFFLELQEQGLEDQGAVNQGMIELSKELSLPLVATNDIHYTTQEDHTAHDALLCIQTGSVIGDAKRLQFGSDQFYFKSAEQMAEVFPNLPQALENTLSIAERCNVDMDFGKIHLPHYEAPEGGDLHSYLEKLCQEGIKEKYRQITPEINERLSYELKVIKETGFSGYFLVVWDFVKFAKERGIKVGPGRGSVGGSIVAYALGITNVDPLEHRLFFERFLNPERVSMPDIDIDFDDERRDEVIEYVTKKYGQDKVAQIITFGTMKARAAIRDAGRVFDVPYGRVDKIAKLVPAGPGVTMEDALKTSPELQQEYESDETVKKIVDTAKSLEGLARHDSTHAAGVVISKEELTNYTPLQRKEERETVTQYSMEAIEKIGLLKIDFLGLRTLTVIDNATKIVKRTQNQDLDLDNVNFEDRKTYGLLQQGESTGVFQLESSGMRALLKEMQPSTFEDIINVLALYRPGPLDSGMVKDFVERKRGKKLVTYVHPSLEPILGTTYGTIVYQEQVMQIASEMAGFSMGEADILRKAMAKPNPKVFAQNREKFVQGAVSKGIAAEKANGVFDLIVHFAGYGFNRAHSCGYAVISYQTAYLKAHYPAEFMAALLTSVMGNKDKVAQYVHECRRMGIEVFPPDINESFQGFTVVGLPGANGASAIRFGLAAVQNIGDGAINSIIRTRKEKGPFKSIYDLCERVDLRALNKRALESLIKAGAFDSLGSTRKHLLATYDQATDAGSRKQKDVSLGQFTFFDQEGSAPEPVSSHLENKEEFSKEELLSQEKEMLGLYVSDHPLLGVEHLLQSQTNVSLSELKEQRDGTTLWVGGIISKIKRTTTRKGDRMVFLDLEDLEGSTEVIVFPRVYEKYQELTVEDAIVRIKGRLDIKEDAVKVIAQDVQLLRDDEKGADKEARKSKKSVKSAPSSLHISFSLQGFDPDWLTRMKEIFKKHPGTFPVFLKLETDDKITTFRLSSEFMVAPTGSLLAELKELLGEKALSLKQ